MRKPTSHLRGGLLALLISLLCFPGLIAQIASPGPGPAAEQGSLGGSVLDASGRPMSNAAVEVRPASGPGVLEGHTDAVGAFLFHSITPGSYLVIAKGSRAASNSLPVTVVQDRTAHVKIVLGNVPGAGQAATDPAPMAFTDKPDFVVSGVTDWTAVGGHGSDVALSTSEGLARATSSLEAGTSVTSSEGAATEQQLLSNVRASPSSATAKRALAEYYLRSDRFSQALPLLQASSAVDSASAETEYDLALAFRGLRRTKEARVHVARALAMRNVASDHLLAGGIAEDEGDPYTAVQQMQQATQDAPLEQNYFAWASELLLHRAIVQAVEIFQRGVAAYPSSRRMRVGLGSALFANARYDAAAKELCTASDLDQRDVETYLLLGKVDQASPAISPCVQDRLQRFLQLYPRSAAANYLVAMSLLRDAPEAGGDRATALLQGAVSFDRQYAPAYLQLGILDAAQRRYPEAVEFYRKAVAADPELAEAHYRLAAAYERVNQHALAVQERKVYQTVKQRQEEEAERQRREIKQFIVLPVSAPSSSGK